MDMKEANRKAYLKEEIDTLNIELLQLRNDRKCSPMWGALKGIDTACIGEDITAKYNNMCAYIDEMIARLQYHEDEDTKNGYTNAYDLYSAGSFSGYHTEHNDHFNSDTTKEYYRDKLIDKFHHYTSLLYYIMRGLPKDARQRVPVPVSASDEPWLLDER